MCRFPITIATTECNNNTVMLCIKAGAYGRKSRDSNHASIQVILLFKTCFYVNTIRLHCAVHTATHVLAHVLCREWLLFKSCFCVTVRSEKNGLLFESYFYPGHDCIRDSTVVRVHTLQNGRSQCRAEQKAFCAVLLELHRESDKLYTVEDFL